MRKAAVLFLCFSLCLLTAGCAARGMYLLGHVNDQQGKQLQVYGLDFGSNRSAVGTGVLGYELDAQGNGKLVFGQIGTEALWWARGLSAAV